MVSELVCMLLEQNKKVAVSAMTGKATSVLRGKIFKKIGERKMDFKAAMKLLKVETIQKLTKESKVVGISDNGVTQYQNKWRKPEEFDYDVLIIDELSMVPQYVSIWWQKTRARVIGLGDFCQLPEVTSEDNKKELSTFRHDLRLPEQHMIHGYGIKVLKEMSSCQLTKVLRSDNDIALLCNDLRDFKASRRQIVDTIKRWADSSEDIDYSTSPADIETGDDWQIICYTNKTCQAINNKLAIGYDYPDDEDKVLLFDNLNPLGLYNGDTIKFKDLKEKIMKFRNTSNGKNKFIILKWQGRMPTATSSIEQERIFAAQFKTYKKVEKETSEAIMNMVPTIIRSSTIITEAQKEEYIQFVKDLREEIPNPADCFSEMISQLNFENPDLANDLLDRSPEPTRVYVVNLDYGYAITTHKSQGSEYPKVCYILEKFDKPLFYTGVSRAKQKVKIINLTKEV